MGRKIFVSYKYADDNVCNLGLYVNSTVRSYVDKFEEALDEADHIYKGEENDEDLSGLEDDTIWEKLKDRIYDSTLTVIFISPGMKDAYVEEKEQWIPWEVSYSLKEVSRRNKKGEAVTSKSNAVLAVVLPDSNNSYSYYLEGKVCCTSKCTTHHTDRLFNIIRKNKFNKNNGTTRVCDSQQTIWTGTCSYIEAVKWSDFISDIDKYINNAYGRQENIEEYEISKEV